MHKGTGEAGWRRRDGKDGENWTWARAPAVSRGITRVRSGRQSSSVGTGLNTGSKYGARCGGMEASGPEMDMLMVLFSLERESRGKKG